MRATPYHEGRHMPAQSLVDASASCPACGNGHPRKPVFRIQNMPRVDLLSCGHCGISSASKMPTPAALSAYYADYYDPDGDHHTFSDPTRFARHITERLTGHIRRLRILDFGGGDGSLALAVADRALCDGYCAEAVVTLVDEVPGKVSEDPRVTLETYGDLADVDGVFDLVIASAVLEHIPEVGDALRRLFSLAAPGAIFYARTPYWAPAARLFRRVDLTFPGHVHDMGAPFWNCVAETFAIDAVVLASQPSLVETEFRTAPVRTLAAHALKAPARLEAALRPVGWRRPLWGIVGGWEVFLGFAE